MEVRYERGVFLPGAGLWLDPWERKDFAFVSHAHADHVAAHARTFCTPATASLIRARGGGGEFETAEFGERREFDGWAATLVPAGHVLGSAQILVESAGETLLYTGDFKRAPGRASEPAAAPRADTLVMETTYGLPHYLFPPREETIARILKFCVEAIEEGATPVLLGYSLGKAQEVCAALAGAGLPLMLHGAVAKLVPVYEEFGIRLPEFRAWNAKASAGHVLVAPPGAAAGRAVSSVRNRRVAAITGWALDPGVEHRMGVDAAFPLSDHADYAELIAHAEAVRPRRVLTLHGFASEFARDLRARGMQAWALTGPDQLEWDEIAPAPRLHAGPELPPLGERGFEGFAALCEAIRTSTGRRAKIELLAACFRRLDSRSLRAVAVWLTGHPFPPAEGRQLHAGAAIIRKALAAASGRPEAEIRAMARRDNDAGKTTAAVLARNGGRRVATIAEVAAFFEALAAARAPQTKVEVLARVLGDAHPLAAAYIVRIITGNLRIGLKEGLVEEALAAAFDAEPAKVREASMLAGDIGAAAGLAATRRLDEARLTLFRAAKCMLATPEPDAEAVWARFGGAVWAEPKMDGVRAQAHCGEGRVEIFSRDLKPLTPAFPEIAEALARAPLSAVLDGEILAWADGHPLPFHALQRRLGRRAADLFLPPDTPVVYCVFDILWHAGEPLLKSPLERRRAVLDGLGLEHPLRVVPVLRPDSAGALERAFREARASGFEGLVVKDPASAYTPGRRGFAWVKLKEELATLDVVVTAAEFGHGRRRAVLSDLTFAVREGSALLEIGKAYSGLTDEEIETLTSEFLSSATRKSGNKVWVEPRVVIEVAFDSIHESDRHPSGLAMRFPRIKRIRHDKTPGEADTLDAARRLVRNLHPAEAPP